MCIMLGVIGNLTIENEKIERNTIEFKQNYKIYFSQFASNEAFQ